MVDVQTPVPVSPSTRAAGPIRPSRPLWRRTRSVLVATVSLLVLVTGVVYVLAPVDASVRLSADEVSGAQPFDHEARVQYSLASRVQPLHRPRPRWTETLYGRIDARGVKVSHLALRVTGAERATRGQAATIRLGTRGTYRAVLHLRPGRYRLTLTLTVHRRHRSVSLVRTLKNKRYYLVRGRVRPSGVVTFLPVTSY